MVEATLRDAKKVISELNSCCRDSWKYKNLLTELCEINNLLDEVSYDGF